MKDSKEGGEKMAKYIVKRILLAIVTIWAVATLTFFLMNLVPGGPFLSEKATGTESTGSKVWIG